MPDPNHPIFQEPPQPSAGVGVELLGAGHDPGMRFYVWSDVLEELWFATGWRPEACFALLTGLYGIGQRGPFIEVTGFEGLDYVEDLGALYAPTRALLEQKIGDRPVALDARQPSPVGLFVHDPGSGAALGEAIARLHLSLLNVPYQIALMADRGSHQLAMYARPPRGAFFNAAFHRVTRLAGGGESE